MTNSDNSKQVAKKSNQGQTQAPQDKPAQAAKKPANPNSRRLIVAIVLLIVLAVLLGAGLFYQNQQYQALNADFMEQRELSLKGLEQARNQAQRAVEQVQKQGLEIQNLRESLQLTSRQLQDLDQAMQMVSDSGSDLLLINDIDHLITIAEQQLALGGNVANAIISLEAAQAQLARANRPALAALQQSINGDIDRLRAVATVNLPVLLQRVDKLASLIETAPLLVPDLVVEDASASSDNKAENADDVAPTEQGQAAADWRTKIDQVLDQLQDAGSAVAQDLRRLFEVRRIDDTAALLMSPDQAQRFRETLKQRAVMAQMALMMRQTKVWQSELGQLANAIEQRYDMHSPKARAALNLARELYDTPITISIPDVDNSISAIAAVREQAQQARIQSQPENESAEQGL